MNPLRQQVIQAYLDAYNRFDVAGMLAPLHPALVFQHYSGAQLTLETRGIEAFWQQAETATTYFSARRQTPTAWRFEGAQVVVEVAYVATLAVDLPNGMRAGEVLELSGQSVFTFDGEQIIGITDRS